MAEQLILTHRISDHARARPSDRAVVCDGQSLSWQQFDRRLGEVASALRALGLGKGDKVALVSRNSIAALEVFFGALRAGCCIVPLSSMTDAHTQSLLLADCDARALFYADDARASVPDPLGLGAIVSGGLVALDFAAAGHVAYEDFVASARGQQRSVEIDPGDDFNLIYSSGTTGTPKGILHSHAMRGGTVARAGLWGFGAEAVNLTSTPLYSNTTMAALLPAVAGGATSVFMRKFDEERFLQLSQAEGVTHAMLVPVQYQRLLAHPSFDRFDLSRYRLKLCTSAPLRAELKAEILARWPGELVEIYGMTEGGAVCLLEARKHPDKLHTVGKPSPQSDVRIIDEQGCELPVGQVGEVVGRQKVMMTGYYKQPAATQAIMWLDGEGRRFQRTGDLGRFDEDGFLQLLDRKKDMIISGGFNVYPVDLEAVLASHPQVADVAVIGIPSERWGETPLGLVVLEPGSTVTVAEIRDWANARLGKTQRLSAVELRTSLPRSPIGKLLKRELRAPYWPSS